MSLSLRLPFLQYMYHAALHALLEFIAACQLGFISSAARLVAMREEKVENMAHEVSPASAKRQRHASGAGSPSPYTTPPASVGPTMSDDMYMLMDEEEKTSVSMSGGRADREVLRVVTEGDTYDDGYRFAHRTLCAVQAHTKSTLPHPFLACCIMFVMMQLYQCNVVFL